MTGEPLVSVVLPTYNRAGVLPRAIQSVLSQDYANLELIVVDDGSTDGTPDLMRQFADARIRFERLSVNCGPGYARNVALGMARGELVAFIDSDDRWLPGKLRRQVGALRAHPELDIVFADYWNCNLTTGERGLGFAQTNAGLARLRCREANDGLHVIEEGLPEGLLWANFIATPTVVVRRTSLLKAGLFDPTLIRTEDLELWLRGALLGWKFGFIPECLIERYKDHTSLSFSPAAAAPFVSLCLSRFRVLAAKYGRRDLTRLARRLEHGAWCAAIREHALRGKRRQALNCFAKALKCGASLRCFAYAAAAMVGPKVNRVARKCLMPR